MLKEFKEFISRGNVLELAVGLILATYFGAIVKSLVDDIIMPPIGKLISGVSFQNLKLVISEAEMSGTEIIVPEIAIRYGLFINHILTFILVAFSVFLIVRAYNNFLRRKKENDKAQPQYAPSKQEMLLEEIRDILREKK
ncbi:large-conductance mechanosensitive channel protein MscL [Halocola ammonii]